MPTAERILKRAGELAHRMNSGIVRTGHVLLAIFEDDLDGFWDRQRVDREAVTRALDQRIPRVDTPSDTTSPLPYTPNMNRYVHHLIRKATDERRSIDLRFMLQCLLARRRSTASDALRDCGIDPDVIYEALASNSV